MLVIIISRGRARVLQAKLFVLKQRKLIDLAVKGLRSIEMSEKKITISDIADELGLSAATVSNVIHGKTKKVSRETIHRVQELLEKRQYIPSMAGILMAQNDTGIIGVVVNQHDKYESHVLEDAFISSSLNYLSVEIEKTGKFMMVKTTSQIQEIVKFASMWNMEGLILIGFCEEDYICLRNSMRVPFVAYDVYQKNPERLAIIKIDNYSGGFQMGQHFKSLGHNHVLCIADNDIYTDRERYEGFRDGFDGDGADFLLIPMLKEERLDFYKKNLEKICKYTAVFAVSDYYAIDLMGFLMSQGIRVPQDISVAGFDDTPLCTQVFPTLTTVRQDGALRAKTAMNKLLELKEDPEAGTMIVLPVTLVERESTRAV